MYQREICCAGVAYEPGLDLRPGWQGLQGQRNLKALVVQCPVSWHPSHSSSSGSSPHLFPQSDLSPTYSLFSWGRAPARTL